MTRRPTQPTAGHAAARVAELHRNRGLVQRDVGRAEVGGEVVAPRADPDGGRPRLVEEPVSRVRVVEMRGDLGPLKRQRTPQRRRPDTLVGAPRQGIGSSHHRAS
jgi:hypothetical protein